MPPLSQETTTNHSKDNHKNNYDALVQHFYNLATRGGGDSARGRYFYMLHALEYAYAEGLESYTPHKKIDQWLVLLFDLITNFQHPYHATLEQNHTTIRHALAQRYQDFIATLKKIGWHHIATITDNITKKHLRQKTELGLYLSLEDMTLFIDNMTLNNLFQEYFPQILDNPPTDGNHPIGRTRLTELRKKFAQLYAEVVQRYREDVAYPLASVQLIASLPFSALRVIEHITTVLQQHENLEPHNYDFAVLYALATNALQHKRSKGVTARWWRAPDAYVDPQRDTNTDLYDTLTIRRQAKTSTRRNYELARLGLSVPFAKAIRVLDDWLEHSPEKLQPLHHHRPWYQHIQNYCNEIDALSAQLRGRVSQAYHAQKQTSA